MPRPILALLAHGEARDTEIIRDIPDDDVAEARVRRKRERERGVHQQGDTNVGSLEERWAV